MQESVKSSRSARARYNYESGVAAEDRVAADYEQRGYPVQQRRWRGKGGEIDLIFGDGAGLVFVEVKQSKTFDDALAHLSPQQVARLYAAAEEFLAGQPMGSLTEVRFDVALVNQKGEFRILENAFC